MGRPKKPRGKLHKRHERDKPIEEKVVTKAIQEEWQRLREAYELFRQDALIPTARNQWTSAAAILEAFDLYCTALGIPNRMTPKKLGTLLRENFVMTHRTTNLYGCIIRPGLFVREADVVRISEV
jgi:hypothetical protein